jgi:acyl-CoA reductase-like NAD-dependent aldehyde dehydrogenase
VLKPASQAPGPAFEIAKACQEAGLPKGVLNVVAGDGRSVGRELAVHPAVVALSFTGSYPGGQQTGRPWCIPSGFRRAWSRLIKL